MPLGGMKQLRAAVAPHVVKALRFDPRRVDPGYYMQFMRILAANFYVDNIQGRVGGFGSMTLKQGRELLHTGETRLERFKTAGKFGYQPVMIGETSRSLLGCYMDRVRRTATTNNDDDAPLWVNSNGKEYDDDRFGRLVTSFFMVHAQL
jgi:hypothetical protein